MTGQDLPSIDIVLDEARRKLDTQFEQIDGLDTKAGIILGIAGVILALLVTTLLGKQDTVVNSFIILIKVALASIFISLILSFLAISLSKYGGTPKLERLRNYYMSKDAEKTKKMLVDTYLQSTDENKKLIEKKVCLAQWAHIILAIGLGILVVWVCLILWQS